MQKGYGGKKHSAMLLLFVAGDDDVYICICTYILHGRPIYAYDVYKCKNDLVRDLAQATLLSGPPWPL